MNKDFSIRAVFGLLLKTAPFLVFRLLVYFGIMLAIILFTLIGSGFGWMIGSIADNGPAGGFIGGLFGFGFCYALLIFFRSWLLYMVKAGHIAVLVEAVDGRPLLGGKGQVDYALNIVRERFVTSNVLFAVDALIKRIIRAFNRVFFNIARLFPIPGAQGFIKFLNTVVNYSLTFLDEVILAYLVRIRAANPWKSSQTALVLYAQNYQAFLKNAVWLTILIWVVTLVIFLLVLAPVAALVALVPSIGGIFTLLLALVVVWAIKQAVIEPFAMTALMQVFFKVTDGQVANPEWEAKLENVSGAFRDLAKKGADWAAEKPEPPDSGSAPASGEPPPPSAPASPAAPDTPTAPEPPDKTPKPGV